MNERAKVTTLGVGLWLLIGGLAVGSSRPNRVETNNSSPPRLEAPRLLSKAELVARIRQLDPGFPDLLEPTGGIGCRIEDEFGRRVTTVPALNQAGEPAAWLQYLSDGEIDHTVRFVVVPAFTNSPLLGQAQLFQTDDACSIVTPFGIPFWGGDRTAGPWRLVIRNDRGGIAVCPFDVVP